MENLFSSRNAHSLMSISIDYIINNLSKIASIELLGELPEHIRNRLLHKFTTTKYFWENIDFKKILALLAHKNSEHIDLTSTTIDNDMLRIIKPCINLREVYLTRVGKYCITTQGLLDLFPHLKRMYLLRINRCNAVTDEVIQCIAQNCTTLSGLDVGGCKQITDKSLIALTNLTKLIWLNFSHSEVIYTHSPQFYMGINNFVKGPSGPKLRELRMAECPNITESMLSSVCTNCPEMEVIEFFNSSRITVTDETLFSFEGSLKNLKQLSWTVQW